VSQNQKIGPVPCSYASIEKYCPATCALKDNGCYAQGGNVRFTEQRVDKGKSNRTLLEAMKKVTRYAKIARHRVSGDVYNPDGYDDVDATYEECEYLEEQGLINIGYTHSWRYDKVQKLKKYFRASCDSYSDLEEAAAMNWALELTVSKFDDDVVEKIKTIDKRIGVELQAVGCPAQKTSNKIDCNTCTLCKVSEKTSKYVVVFYTHGGLKKKADRALKQ